MKMGGAKLTPYHGIVRVYIISLCFIQTTSETVAYEVIIKWTKHELTVRMKLIDEMMALCDFTRMNSTFLAKTVANEVGICCQPKIHS